METKIEVTIPFRVKTLLELDGEHGNFELLELLRLFRNASHPDHFQDAEMKAKAESRFKEAGSLLSELERFNEQEMLSRKPAELIAYKPLYEVAKLNSERDALKAELKTTKELVDQQFDSNERLRKSLDEKADNSLKDEIAHVRSLYRPSSRRFASFGLAIILSGALGTMTQMERVSLALHKYSPVEPNIISTALFICFLLLITNALRQLWESEYIRKKSAAVCSPRYALDFYEFQNKKSYILDKDSMPDFSEMEAFEFLSGPQTYFIKTLGVLGFTIFRPETIDRLKDVFLHNLLNKRLIEPSRAATMQRYFRVISSRPYHELYHERMMKYEQFKSQSNSSPN